MKLTNYLKTAICVSAVVALVGCAGTRYNRSTGQYIDDKATATRVKAALVKDSLVKASEVKVESFRGNIHLTGFVDHPAQKERASQLTRNVKGVDWFKNDIVVKESLPGERQMINEAAGANRDESYNQRQESHQRQSFQRQSFSGSSAEGNGGWQKGALNVYDPAADISARPSSTVRGNSTSTSASADNTGFSAEASGSNNELTQRVYTQLRSDNSSAAQNVRVETSANGKIILRGTVSSNDEKRMIEDRIKAIEGVNKVENKLEVKSQ